MKFIGSALAFVFFLASQGSAQNVKKACPSMELLAQYLMLRDAEISPARGCGAEINFLPPILLKNRPLTRQQLLQSLPQWISPPFTLNGL